ncbi:MAG: thioredoxin domain-containing protein, partial [Anaerovoracaceae bacterium]
MNHLKNETSPYLLQHAENPVDWYPWSEAAFEKARKEDKPIFLSIGYSTCHWCHVMAEECFEDKEVAKELNHYFVPVKVDREERPDIDAVYMTACQLMTGSGGWPLNLFLTADGKPFFAGTYFPKQASAARPGMPGLLELLDAIRKAWKSRRKELMEAAGTVVQQIRRSEERTGVPCGMDEEALAEQGRRLAEQGVQELKRSFDSQYGGFGMAPKFPAGHNLLFLMEYYQQTGDRQTLEMIEKTLTQMQKGGLYDHLGGGFCRYSTDRFFLAPHFEKMLYDNALLIVCYGQAWALTKKKYYLDAAERTGEWILREMRGENGGFYSAQDADSQGEEGRFYTFTRRELIEQLGKNDGPVFCSHYGVTEAGNFEGKNILHLLGHENPWEGEISLREKVFQYRKKRYPLHTDDKILTAWNGMAVWALSWLFRLTGNKTWLKAAEDCCRMILKQADRSPDLTTLFVSYRKGSDTGTGFLDDYAWFVCGLLGLYEATSKRDWLEKAQRFQRKVMKEFGDPDGPGFFMAG